MDVDASDETVPHEYTGSYEGIVPMLKRWFVSTCSTEFLRDWVQQFTTLKTCRDCNGARLEKESLWFIILGRNISQLGEMSLDNLAACFHGVELRTTDKQKNIGKDVLKVIRERLQFL